MMYDRISRGTSASWTIWPSPETGCVEPSTISSSPIRKVPMSSRPPPAYIAIRSAVVRSLISGHPMKNRSRGWFWTKSVSISQASRPRMRPAPSVAIIP